MDSKTPNLCKWTLRRKVRGFSKKILKLKGLGLGFRVEGLGFRV